MALTFVACLSKEVGDASGDDLTLGRLYEVRAEENGLLRIVDDSGEDFLYPASCFEPVVISEATADRLHRTLLSLVA